MLSDKERKEWLYLLPRMNDEQARELDRILSVKVPSPSSPSPQSSTAAPSPAMPTGRQARGEGNMEKTIRHPLPPMKREIPVSRAERVHMDSIVPKATLFPSPSSGEGGRRSDEGQPSPRRSNVAPSPVQGEGNKVSSFANLTLKDLQAAPSVHIFLEELNGQIKNALAVKIQTAENIVADFEKNEIYQAYIQTGMDLMSGKPGKLNREQFEAIADFCATLQHLG